MGRRIFAVLVTACTLAVVFAALAPTGAGAPVPAPPFKPGTVWTQRHTLITPAGEKRTGTITQIYRGLASYRGRTFHYFVTSSTLVPDVTEREYAEWDGAHLGQAALVTTDAQHTVTEILFDKPLTFGVPANTSGSALVFMNDTQTATLPWSYSAAPLEMAKVTVPAGTFQATRWAVELKLGAFNTTLTIYSVGIMGVRRDSKEYVNGSLVSTTSMELISGPVR